LITLLLIIWFQFELGFPPYNIAYLSSGTPLGLFSNRISNLSRILKHIMPETAKKSSTYVQNRRRKRHRKARRCLGRSKLAAAALSTATAVAVTGNRRKKPLTDENNGPGWI
ncbi:MAG: hypothetical protein ACYSTG_08750, partial [Planctomycetota bacterium]